MFSNSPSSPSLAPHQAATDDGFMVVPVWDPVEEVQIGSVVWEDPFLGFGLTPAPIIKSASSVSVTSQPPSASAADAVFVDVSGDAPATSYHVLPYPHAAQQPPQPQPQSQPQVYPNQPPAAYPPQQGEWWEEASSLFPEAQEPQPASLDEFFSLPDAPQPQPQAPPAPVRSPQEILDEIVAEANQMESESSRVGSASPDNSSWWASEDTDSSSSPGPLDAAFDPSFRSQLLNTALDRQPRRSHHATTADVVSITADQLPPAARKAAEAGARVEIVVPVAGGGAGKKAAKKRKPVTVRKTRKAPDARERKKEQNRVAATRYREKKRSSREILLAELEAQEQRRATLRKKEEDALNEIAYLRDLLQKVKEKS